MLRIPTLFCILISAAGSMGDSWVDTLVPDLTERGFRWDWQDATVIRACTWAYEYRDDSEKSKYLDYVREKIDGNMTKGTDYPNLIAPAVGFPFLYRVTGEQKYLDRALEVYQDYLDCDRVPNGGVSHTNKHLELWDDTIYMIGIFLLEMFKTTGDSLYASEFIDQVLYHREKLEDTASGLWVHGWDADDNNSSQWSLKNWQDPETRRSPECWGRGNGWIMMAIGDALLTIPQGFPRRDSLENTLKRMTHMLPQLQDDSTGLWYQLPLYPAEDGNWIESSCTAMFGYAITAGLIEGVLEPEMFAPVIDKAFNGLRTHSSKIHNGEIKPTNACGGTGIGDKEWYYNRGIGNGGAYTVASYGMFGMLYDSYNDEVGMKGSLAPRSIGNPRPALVVEGYNVKIAGGSAPFSLRLVDTRGRLLWSRSMCQATAQLPIDKLSAGKCILQVRDQGNAAFPAILIDHR